MVISKTKKLTYILLLLAFSLIPFGQLWGVMLQQIFSAGWRIHPVDILLILIFVINLPYLINNIYQRLKFVFLGFTFSYLWGIYLFGFSLVPLLYLLRFLSVISIYQIASFLNTKKVLNSAYYISIFSAVIGWVQYLLIPDMRGMYFYGWDDHYYRMVGAFFDPAYLGVFLVIGTLTAIYLKKSLISVLFLIVSLAFTYSRASYLALVLGILLLKKLKGIYLVIILAVILPLLPRPGGYGVKLTRTHSIVAKAQNYDYSLNLIGGSPLLGQGFNYICNAKNELNIYDGNACSGLDNSFLFMLATLGVPVSLVLLDFYINIYLTTLEKYKSLILSLFTAVGVHSLFTNTAFYIPILFILMLIFSVTADMKASK